MEENTIEIAAQEGDIQHELILAAARKRGVETIDLSDSVGKRAALLQLDGKTELLVAGIPTSMMNMQTRFLCDLKQLTKTVFEMLSIPYPQSILLSAPDEDAVSQFVKPGKQYVCKPQCAANGLGVQLGITTYEEVAKYFDKNIDLDENFLLEEQVEGTDIRIQVIGGKIVAACIREPAFVLGDGQLTVVQLVDRRREVIASQNPSNQLILDQTSLDLIAKQGLSLNAIAEKDQKVVLKEVTNMGQGGVAIDITDDLHPLYHEWIEKINNFIQSDYYALDLIGQSPEADPREGCIALELNAQAEWVHHTFSERRTHDLASLIITEIFGS